MLTISNPATFDWSSLTLADCAEGNAVDTYFTLRLFETLQPLCEEEGVWDLSDKLLGPLTPEIAEMEFLGLDVSEDAMGDVGIKLRDLNIDIEDNLYRFPEVSNTRSLFSPEDIGKILFLDEDGFALYPPKFTENIKEKTGDYPPSTDKECLEDLMIMIEEELSLRGKNG